MKGWSSGDATHERVFDVARADAAGAVDPLTCETSGAGAQTLCTVWRLQMQL